MRRRLVATLSALLVAVLSGCAYMKERLGDAGDMFFVSTGPALGLSAEAFVDPAELGCGRHAAMVFGWEGRSWIHRYEKTRGAGLFSTTLQRDVRDMALAYSAVDPRSGAAALGACEAMTYMNRRFMGLFSLVGLDSLPLLGPLFKYFEPRISLAGLDISDWEIGASVTPGLATARAGVRPSGVANFATGWLGFHLFPPYEFLSNKFDARALLLRGILPDAAAKGPVKSVLAGLKDPSAQIRAHSLKVLTLMGPKASPHLDNVLALLGDSAPGVRILAALAAHRIDPRACDARSVLLALAEDPDYGTQAREALAIIGKASDTR